MEWEFNWVNVWDGENGERNRLEEIQILVPKYKKGAWIETEYIQKREKFIVSKKKQWRLRCVHSVIEINLIEFLFF